MCALDRGRSVATTMSFTALDGLMMGTRCGAIDPGVLLYLLDHEGLDVRGLERLLYQQSGLLGVSGISSDMRELLARSDPAAGQALDLFVYRVSRDLGSLAAALGGLDALVFTARARLPAGRLAGAGPRRDGQRRRGAVPESGGQPGVGLGDSDQRGAHDRAAHAARAGRDFTNRRR
jgi:hypothetical protein